MLHFNFFTITFIALITYQPSFSQNKNMKLLFLGDSYTVGESVKKEESYPYLLINELKVKGHNVSESKIIATTGWTTSDLMNAIAGEEDLRGYDATFLLIGVNNQYQHKPITLYEKEFKLLLNSAISFTNFKSGKVFVISIPDYGFTPHSYAKQPEISKELDQYNLINKRLSEESEVNYVNITPVSREGLKNPKLVSADTLHPSGQQYKLWVREILPVLLKVIEQSH